MVSRSQRVCCLCEFPAADGGVHLADVDAEKWAEWCRRELDVEKIGGDEEAEHTLICQYCIWEARLVHESSLDDSCRNHTTDGCDWWTGHDNDYFFREYFYKTPSIQPCKVVLEKISVDGLGNTGDVNGSHPRYNAILEAQLHVHHESPLVENQSDNLSPKTTFKIFQCSLCLKSYQNRKSLGSHMSQTHKNAFRCKNYNCIKYFLNEDERQQHEEKFHLNGEFSKHVKCIYCGALISRNKGNLHFHMKTQHKEAIKCDFKQNCPNYFHTDSEKKEHIYYEHTKGLHLKITPMKCIYCHKISKNKIHLASHINRFHKDVILKCRVNGCLEYFLSEKESEKHFLEVHQHADSLKKCSYKSNDKPTFQDIYRLFTQTQANMNSYVNCPLCPKCFLGRVNLKIHLTRVHAECCSCQYCGKILQKVSMSSHYLSGACKPDAHHI